MTIEKITYIAVECDYTDCGKVLTVQTDNRATADERAASEGWTAERNYHRCPKHKGKEDYSSNRHRH